jgi:hypothetical protein
VEAPVNVERVSKAEAVQITESNVHDVAEWCGGTPMCLFLGNEINTVALGNPRQKYTVGDWIIHEDGRFFGVTASAFAVLYRDAS